MRLLRALLTPVLACAVVVLAQARLPAEDDPVRPEQLQELQDSLIEGLSQNDWKLIELPLKGFQAAGEKGAALEKRLDDAYREAALRMITPVTRRVQLEVNLLAARARGGDEAAVKQLRAYAEWNLEHFADLKDAAAAGGAFGARQDPSGLTGQLEFHTQSLLALARLGDSCVPGIAEQWLTSARPAKAGVRGANWSDPLVRAYHGRLNGAVKALQALNAEAGTAVLDKVLADPKLPRVQRLEICQAGLTTEGTTGPLSKQSFANRMTAEVEKLDATATQEEAMVLGMAMTAGRIGRTPEDPALTALGDKIVEFCQTKASGEAKQTLENYTRWYSMMRARAKGEPPKAVRPPMLKKDADF